MHLIKDLLYIVEYSKRVSEKLHGLQFVCCQVFQVIRLTGPITTLCAASQQISLMPSTSAFPFGALLVR